MDDLDAIRTEVEAIKGQVTLVAAENLAVQFVLTCLFRRLSEADASFGRHILHAFDDAANYAEKFSILGGKQSGHVAETLRIIEQMRLMLVGEDKPKREV